jgi:hypothetical protein
MPPALLFAVSRDPQGRLIAGSLAESLSDGLHKKPCNLTNMVANAVCICYTNLRCQA